MQGAQRGGLAEHLLPGFAIQLIARALERHRIGAIEAAERAAMGLCFENPPHGFSVRYASPVDPVTRTTPRWSWVYHVANNYSKKRMTPFAKTRTEHLFGVRENINVWRPPRRIEKFLDSLRR